MKAHNAQQIGNLAQSVIDRVFRVRSIVRVGTLLMLAGLFVTSFYWPSSASVSKKVAATYPPTATLGSSKLVGSSSKLTTRGIMPAISPASYVPFSPLPPSSESIDTFAADCSTPKTSFAVGDTVCVKVSGVPVGSFFARRLLLGNANSTIIESTAITSDPQTFTFVVNATSVIGGNTVDNRGSWQAIILNPFFYYPEASGAFTVADPQNSTADVAIATTSSPGGVQAGTAITFELELKNYGPDSSASVQLTDAVPSGTTFVDFQQVSGPTFTCNSPASGAVGTTTCSIASLDWPGPSARFVATYQVNAGTPANTAITNTATISSTTNDQNTHNDSTSDTATVIATPAGQSCSFDCPNNIVATATGPSGAIVSFASAVNLDGDCGAISATPSSGSLFPLGVTTVNVTSEAGPVCNFTVTVVDTPAPTISCPVDKSATADQTGFATVNPGTPATTPASGITVVSRRSDDTPAVYDEDGNLVSPEVIVPLTAPYPIGTTGIAWTASDSVGRTATCTQRIIVHGVCASDSAPPTITAPADINVGTGPGSTTCGVVLDDELGLPEATDDCSATVSSTGIPAGNLFPIGVTTITYTATDGAGHTASAIQHVTVVENTPPVIVAPANASYVCPSEVPAANPAQAHGADPNLPDGGPPTDNCGIAAITVSESTNNGAGSAGSPLVITRTFKANDAAGNISSSTQTITVIDATPPTITAPANASYQCAGDVPVANPAAATASDNCAAPVVTVADSNNGGAGSTSSPLVITRVFTATDAAGNSASASQTITVIDTTPPTITAPANASYQCANAVPAANPAQATASDNCSTPTVTVSQTNNGGAGSSASPLIITRTYTATDPFGNSASASQVITVVDNMAPVIVLTGPNPQVVECHTVYLEMGAIATDNCSGSSAATPSGTVNVNVVGSYTISYSATDAAGNSLPPITRTVNVVDTTKPIITRNGAATMTVECHTSFTDPGATAADTCDSSVPVTVSGSVNVNATGTYTLVYNASDDSGNAAIPVTRTVNVVDTIAPTITVSATPISMWPPNHQLVTFTVASLVTGVSDSCNTSLNISNVTISQVTSDENNSSGDMVIAADCKSVQLRREREGGGDGRVYTITFRVRDAAGNTSYATKKITVPHDQGNGSNAVDSGPHSTVMGSCP